MKNLGISLIIATAALGVSNANANINKSPSELHTLKGKAPTGTHILSVEAVSPLPFNKRYAALTNAQKEIVRSKYENLGVNDTPPFPSRGLKSIYAPVIGVNKSLGKVGELRLIATINENGRVSNIVVQETPSKALSKRAIRSLRNASFDAASCDGAPCEMTFPMAIKFQ